MSYTVKKLSELSGVSIRTLRWYDEVELLKPAYYGSNGYRYYEEEQILKLQQILFYRELDLHLDDIKRILESNDFDKIKALHSHKGILKKRLERTTTLIKTIDKTISHLRGGQEMKDEEIYKGFNIWAEGKGSESYFIGTSNSNNTAAETIVLKSTKKANTENWEKADWEKHVETAHNIYRELVGCIKAGLEPSAEDVQKIVKKHHSYTLKFHRATQEVYKALATLYQENPEYIKQMEPFHPHLAPFLAEAMEVFAESNLS